MTQLWDRQQKLLVISPHPDDEVIGCGGLMAKVKKFGGEVYVLILTVGNEPQYGGESNIERRINETASAMQYLEVNDYEVSLIGDDYHLKLDKLPEKQLIDLIEKDSKVSLNKIGPTIVALPSINSYNQDHRAAFRAGFTACRPRPSRVKPFSPIVLSYEGPYLSWALQGFLPNFYVDITDYLDIKVKALSLYKSQIREDPHGLTLENIRRLAELRGREICVKSAEAFICHRFLS